MDKIPVELGADILHIAPLPYNKRFLKIRLIAMGF
jgi:hypothetical protein